MKYLGFEIAAEEFKSIGIEEPFIIQDGVELNQMNSSWKVLAFQEHAQKLLLKSFFSENLDV